MDGVSEVQTLSPDLGKKLDAISAGRKGLTFSRPALKELTLKIHAYSDSLIEEAARISQLHQADSVSASDVRHAFLRLSITAGSRVGKWVGTLGGVLLGAALSNFLGMSVNETFPTVATLLSASLGILGSFLIALSMGRNG